MNPPNNHNFKFNLPLHPSESADCEVKMDGRDLQGVSSLTVRAGSNGFTNVVVEFEANCAVEFAGCLVANMNGMTHDEQCLKLASIYQEAKAEIDAELETEGAELDSEFYAQAQFVRRIIELTIERVK